ncbi:HD domain-containing protein [Paracidovorax anthurii]|uniref:HD domain-containing protein n=2 Tax=Paracidovorax anthurii TaxID=78229 RepID=A0A328YMF0_9BURK|nr:HD domain-containing phosphohydrolase [Paracidovorax anthurii]RAR74015.1 HD domain-containing protein [Paracidovorax anthurii]
MNDNDSLNSPPDLPMAAAMAEAEADARELAEDGTHYLRGVTDMAERVPVVTRDAIYTASGIKLVDKGARIDGRLYDRLVEHKLRDPIDRMLSAGDTVDVAAIEAVALAQCEGGGAGLSALIARVLGGPGRLLAPLRGLPLPPPLAFKLTVMRDQRPELFAHSVGVTLVALYLAIRCGWSERDATHLAAAALLHDVGVLHMDPVWRDPEHKVSGADRRHLVAHPITAMLMLRAQPDYPPSVGTAVLEHHERMDGSGYPRGLQGRDISPMGQILMLAEVVAAFFEKYHALAAQRLSLGLRLNHRKFPAQLVAFILPLLSDGRGTDEALARSPHEDAGRNIAALEDAFDRWGVLREGLPPAALAAGGAQASSFLEERLKALQQSLIEAGSHPRQQAEILEHLHSDPQGMAELALVRREALWQLESIVHATLRRWPRLGEGSSADPADAAAAAWCAHCTLLLATA